jgi:hypothetical protein
MDQIELASFAPNQNRNWGEAALNLLSFQVDLWGQLRRATEASRANLPSADWNRKAVITTTLKIAHDREKDEAARAALQQCRERCR